MALGIQRKQLCAEESVAFQRKWMTRKRTTKKNMTGQKVNHE